MCATAVHPEDRIEISCVDVRAARKVAAALGPGVAEYDATTHTLMIPALLNDVSWEQYELLLEKLPEHRMRHTYDRGGVGDDVAVAAPRVDQTNDRSPYRNANA